MLKVSGGPWKIGSVLLSYWILVKIILPNYMKNRPPYDLKNVILIYNTIMVIINALFFLILLGFIDYGRIFLDFNYPDRNDRRPQTMQMLYYGWLGYISRYFDMFDTIFFALRKKNNQITFLHVYHHMIVPFLGNIDKIKLNKQLN